MSTYNLKVNRVLVSDQSQLCEDLPIGETDLYIKPTASCYKILARIEFKRLRPCDLFFFFGNILEFPLTNKPVTQVIRIFPKLGFFHLLATEFLLVLVTILLL